MSNPTVQAAAEGMPVFKSSNAALEALSLAGFDEAERSNLIEAFVETLSEAEVQTVGAKINALADRNSLVTLLDGMSPEARGEVLASARQLAQDEGTPTFLTLRANPAALSRQSIYELHHLSGAIRTLSEVATALICQPRFGEGEFGYDCLVAIDTFFLRILARAREELERRTADNADDEKLRAETVVAHQFSFSDDLETTKNVLGDLFGLVGRHPAPSADSGREGRA